MSRLSAKVTLAIAASVIVVLMTEGALSLFWGRSLRPNALLSFDLGGASDVDGANDATDAAPGWLRSSYARPHPNPKIGVEVATKIPVTILGQEVVLKPDGTRTRPGPPAGKGGLRVVVLGDSVAFGVGLPDDQTIAAQVEALLDSVSDRSGRAVACFTLAAPGWSARNSVAALLDGIDSLAPDVVVFVPVDNDLCDTVGVELDGAVAPAADVLARNPLLYAGLEVIYGRLSELARAAKRGTHAPPSKLMKGEFGAIAINAGLTAASTSRYEAERDALQKLARVLAARGSRLYVQFYVERGIEPAFARVMQELLLTVEPPIQLIPGLRKIDRRLTFPQDNHPAAAGAAALALEIARRLVADGLVKLAAGAALPAHDETVAALIAPQRSTEEIHELADAARQDVAAKLLAKIDATTGYGCLQVIGGLNSNGTLGPDFVVALKRVGRRVRVRLAALDPPPPLDVEIRVEVDLQEIGTITIPASALEPIERVLEAPGATEWFDLRLASSDWWTIPGVPRRHLASCRLLAVESLPD